MNKYLVMGVSGCGKSTIAAALAKQTGGVYLDADDYHPESNRKKMAAGIPLDDEDRQVWLETLAGEIKRHDAQSQGPLFLACSALKQSYRTILARGCPDLQFVFLDGERELLLRRLKNRHDHFMPASLFDSQLATLEKPDNAIRIEIDQTVDEMVAECLRKIAVTQSSQS